jgi:hypothetical protein
MATCLCWRCWLLGLQVEVSSGQCIHSVTFHTDKGRKYEVGKPLTKPVTVTPACKGGYLFALTVRDGGRLGSSNPVPLGSCGLSCDGSHPGGS